VYKKKRVTVSTGKHEEGLNMQTTGNPIRKWKMIMHFCFIISSLVFVMLAASVSSTSSGTDVHGRRVCRSNFIYCCAYAVYT